MTHLRIAGFGNHTMKIKTYSFANSNKILNNQLVLYIVNYITDVSNRYISIFDSV